jgi:hypothetical protein
VKWSARGKTSRSFIFVLAVFVVGAAAYIGWEVVHPEPHALSERIVRDARRELNVEIRELQRKLNATVREAQRAKKDASAEIDKEVQLAMEGIDDIVARARDRLLQLEISPRTQRNRVDRVEGRADEAREMIRELTTDAKQKATEAAPRR